MTDSETNGRSRQVDDESDEDASEAQALVIASLRAQVTDLFSQVTQLNSKLVSSYDRVSDLEDQLHDASSSLRNASVTISSLELERSHHLAALNTGLLVEKAHVTAELNRLMERATEEAAQRGQAESARHDIEKDLDDLSATLFDQANTMVAEARLNQAKGERKVQEAEQALKIAEDAVKDMQVQMQSLEAAKEAAELDVQGAKLTMGKGKWVERDDLRIGGVPRIRFMTTHAPYSEFIAFVAHLRGLKATQPTPPVISTLLSQPFIARLLTEDSEPTVRLDLAPSLNWLSRRAVLTAIHMGMLTVEPWPFSNLARELHRHPQSMSSTLSCALCGAFIARVPSSTTSAPRSQNSNGSSWFKYPVGLGTMQNSSSTDTHGLSTGFQPPEQVYIFRLAPTASTPPPALPPLHTTSASVSAVGTSTRHPPNSTSSPRVLPTQTQNLPYPLCTSNYCLARLRSTCSLWAFVRVGVVERVWEEAIQPSKSVNGDSQETSSLLTGASTGGQPGGGITLPSTSEKPPVPPRRRRLWEMASALGERAVSWGKENGENIKEKAKEETDSAKKLPTPPPSHPSAPHPHPLAESPTSRVDPAGPPPLPKRNVVREKATTDSVAAPLESQNEIVTPEIGESAAANGHVDPDKADPNTSDSPSETTFTALPSPSPSATSRPVSAESSAPPIEDHSPPSPHNVPLPISRVTSPVPRPHRSRLSSPASPPPSSRPASPAISLSRSRAGSPTPTGIPGSTASHIRGKLSVSSPLAPMRSASPAPATGPGAPPVPRRAAARRVAPPPPPAPSDDKVVGEVGKEETRPLTVVTATDPTPEVHLPKSTETAVQAEPKAGDGEGEGGVETTVPPVAFAPAPTTETATQEPAKNGTAGDTEELVNGTFATTEVSDPSLPPASESNGARASMDTTRTKQSSSTEEECFASDATWEDRTWKELMRLKEDMFWARIGGIRPLRE